MDIFTLAKSENMPFLVDIKNAHFKMRAGSGVQG
jgi:hypothetical protein